MWNKTPLIMSGGSSCMENATPNLPISIQVFIKYREKSGGLGWLLSAHLNKISKNILQKYLFGSHCFMHIELWLHMFLVQGITSEYQTFHCQKPLNFNKNMIVCLPVYLLYAASFFLYTDKRKSNKTSVEFYNKEDKCFGQGAFVSFNLTVNKQLP